VLQVLQVQPELLVQLVQLELQDQPDQRVELDLQVLLVQLVRQVSLDLLELQE